MTYLYEQLTRLIELFPGTHQQGMMRDGEGVYAISITGPSGKISYFVAKDSMKGNIVSVHRELLERARMYGNKIIMSVKGTLYIFSPQEIEVHPTTFKNNWKGITMVNFSIEAGKRLLPEEKQTPAPELFDSPVTRAVERELGGERQ